MCPFAQLAQSMTCLGQSFKKPEAAASGLTGADKRIRTSMKLPSHGPEPCASANSAISANMPPQRDYFILQRFAIFASVFLKLFSISKIQWARHKPGSVFDDHLSWLPVTSKLMRPTSRAATGSRLLRPFWSCSRWGLHERYVTISPCELLPHNFNLTTALPVSAECFCCTFPTVTCAGRYPASSPCGARTFLMHPADARDRLSYP